MRIVSVLAAATVALAASPAAAAITTIVLTGVASGSDNGHLSAAAPFGTPALVVDVSTGATSAFVFERAFTLTLRVDDSLGAIDTFPDGDAIYGAGPQSPMTATFAMSGFSYDFGNASSDFSKSPDQIYGGASENRQRPPMVGDFTNVMGALDFNIIPGADVFQARSFGEPAQWTRAPGDTASGHLTLALQDTTGTELLYLLGPVRTADLDLRFDAFTIAAAQLSPGPVPEPRAWALMIAGFGLAGAALRRRQRAAVEGPRLSM